MTGTVSVRLPKGTEEKMRRLAEREHRSLEETIGLLAEEALKMREIPGVYFMDGPTGRRARLVGGPDVWEVIEPYVYAKKDWQALRESYPRVSEDVLRTALRYYEAYPEEIDERIERNGRI